MRNRGFTLIELLVVIAIIAVLMAVLLPALGRGRAVARDVVSASGLKQVMAGYTQYEMEHRGHVLFGYAPKVVNGQVTTADVMGLDFGASMQYLLADRYPWRLSPYVAEVWGILHHHDGVPELPRPNDTSSENYNRAYTLALGPTFGINAAFVGGHKDAPFSFNNHAGNYSPIYGGETVFYQHAIKHPSNLIVFANSRLDKPFSSPGGQVDEGSALHYVSSPVGGGRNWELDVDGSFISYKPGVPLGLPRGWFTEMTVVGYADGHVERQHPRELDNMTLWSNKANAVDYDPL